MFYGGKGGVGKTTCAAARAVAEAAAGSRVLVVSTDPAHSLGDALGVRLSSKPRPIGAARRLTAVELDAPRAFQRWLQEHRQPLGEILEHGTWLDPADVDAMLDLPIPGVDELVGIIEIARIAGGAGYDLIVVDTAPTGHTLRLLAAPDTVATVAEILDGLQQEHRVIRDQLARVGRPEASDRLIAMLAEQARDTAAQLRDRKRTAFHWVTLPEALSLAEAEDGIAALERARLRVAEVVVNRVLPDGGPCPICDRRRVDERRVIATIARGIGRGRRVRVVPAVAKEPRGVPALASLARVGVEKRPLVAQAVRPADGRAALHPNAAAALGTPAKRRATSDSATRSTSSMRAAVSLAADAATVAPESIAAFNGASLLFFGGKGGVGKTTVAAATALRLAKADPDRQLLLLSTDPAHSLSDVFETRIGDTAAALPRSPRNLVVRELNAAAALEARRAQFESALDEITSAVGTSALNAEATSELMRLAPPGIDELFGIISVVDARADYQLIVVDTAPTGHALRLLEMPEAAREWLQVLLRVLLKYRSLVRPGQLASELVDLSKSIRELQTLLRDAAQTRFIVVTRAAEVPRRETERLLTRLRRLHLATPAMVVNALTLLPGRCAICRATAAAERRELAALRVPRGCVIIRTPLSAPPPRGIAALERWAGRWITKG